jgi:NodT family efflux transporter outer membrane factor (OMF) lipoprotein
VLLAGAALAGCRLGPDYAPPEIAMPDAWHQEFALGEFQDGYELARWWEILQDPVLDGLVERAAVGNLDVRTALARIDEARARYAIVAGQRYPDVNAFGSGDRVRPSENEPFGVPGFEASNESIWQFGVDAFWEVDLWGRVARSIESAEADVQTSIELERDVRVTLFAEVAATYVFVRTSQERLRIAQENVERQQESLDLAQVRFDTGLSPKLDVAQAQRILATTESVIPALEQDFELSKNRLAVLLGQHPGTLDDELNEPSPIPSAPVHVVAGIPANLLRQRPDLRAAERSLASATALIGVAEADLYPQFGLRGNYGYSAEDFSDLTKGSSRNFNVGGVLSWNLFDGGRVRGNIDATEARVEQALSNYEQAVLLALEESEGALTSFVLEQVREEALGRAEVAARESLNLSRDLYREGLTDFQNVIDAQQALLDVQDLRAVSQGLVTGNLVGIYKAMGGGWDPVAEGAVPDPNAEQAPAEQ